MRKHPRKEIVSLQQNARSAILTSQLGTAAALVLSCPNYRLLRVASVGAWLRTPILLKQICFFYDRAGRPIGYITWAYLAQDVEEKMVSNPNFLLHFSEWNEGDRLWIIDFVAPNGMVGEIVSFIRRHMFKEFSELRYIRRDSSGKARKVCLWKNSAVQIS